MKFNATFALAKRKRRLSSYEKAFRKCHPKVSEPDNTGLSNRFCDTSIQWPVRLSARTPGFHPGKRGSIPLRATLLNPATI